MRRGERVVGWLCEGVPGVWNSRGLKYLYNLPMYHVRYMEVMSLTQLGDLLAHRPETWPSSFN